MYQYDDPTVTSVLPPSTASGASGYFTDGNPGGGQAATILRAEFMNMLMMEILNTVTGAGITPSKSTNTQLRDAINAYIAEGLGGIPTIPDASTTVRGIVELATSGEVQGGTDSERAVTPLALNSILVGSVSLFTISTAPPGWMKCNGAAISRSTYSALFSVIGTTFGAGNGSTTFNLPDLRGEFLRGWDDARGVDSGRTFGSAQTSQNLAHTHSLVGYLATNDLTTQQVIKTMKLEGSQMTVTDSIQSSGGTEARPRNIALLACIKY